MVPYPLRDLLVEQVKIVEIVKDDMKGFKDVIGDDFDELCMMIACI